MCVFPGFFHLRVPESSTVGSAVGRIKAHDLDIGRNAEVEYIIVPGDGGNMFDITTNEHTQEGIIILKRVWSSSRRMYGGSYHMLPWSISQSWVNIELELCFFPAREPEKIHQHEIL